jgi:hypothetical protein
MKLPLAHAEDGVPGLRSANSYSLRPGTPPSAGPVALEAQRAPLGSVPRTNLPAAGSGAAHAVNKNWLNAVGGPASGCVREKAFKSKRHGSHGTSEQLT